MKLRLKQVAFDEVFFRMAPNFDPTEYHKGRFRIPMGHDFLDANISIEFSATALDKKIVDADLEEQYHPVEVELEISGQPKPGKQFPYTFKIRVSGLFYVDDPENSPIENRLRFCKERGTPQLVSPIRELLANLSSRAYFGEVNLPPINMPAVIRRTLANEEKLSVDIEDQAPKLK
ncbi:hypothetical protein ACU4HD_44605 (plasmid) [Cupriavidus basilensis]